MDDHGGPVLLTENKRYFYGSRGAKARNFLNAGKPQVTLVDFTVTQKGLEEQLLGRVIGKEQKALEEQLSDVLEEVNSNTKVPVGIHEKIVGTVGPATLLLGTLGFTQELTTSSASSLKPFGDTISI